ncbi:43569_t:CDS:1, partial [Gigaspora margarita]
DIFKTSTELYLKRIHGLILPLKPNISPLNPCKLLTIPNFKEYDGKIWYDYFKDVEQVCKQTKIDSDWLEIFSIYNYANTIIQQTKDKQFTFETDREKNQITMFKDSVPVSASQDQAKRAELQRKKNCFISMKILIETAEQENISNEEVLQKLSGIGVTIHYLSRVKNTMFTEVVKELLEEIKK